MLIVPLLSITCFVLFLFPKLQRISRNFLWSCLVLPKLLFLTRPGQLHRSLQLLIECLVLPGFSDHCDVVPYIFYLLISVKNYFFVFNFALFLHSKHSFPSLFSSQSLTSTPLSPKPHHHLLLILCFSSEK